VKNKFLIVMPFYNAQKWVSKSIKSVKLQNYENFHCIVADDCSTDQSYEICKQSIGDDGRFTLIRSETNLGPLGNAYEAAINHADSKDDIIVILDGDDFFYSPNTLQILNDAYNTNNCWMTYGSYINLSDKSRGKFSKQLPDHIIDNSLYRNYQWSTSHLRSYKFELLKKVNRSDLLDEDGEYFRAACDLALIYPLLEISGYRAKFVNNILYIWNDLNELNEHKIKMPLQIRCEQKIRSMAKYKKLEEL
jgi:glycosyltransferase involved in cell wall biosynthesis